MAKYSKEYTEKQNTGMSNDFSVEKVFQKLKDGESLPIICEGFGFTAISDRNDECFVLVNGHKVPFESISGIKLVKKNNYGHLWKLLGGITIAWLVSMVILYLFFRKNAPETAQFGDMFGVVNALFSGLALGGVIYTIFLQKDELKLQRKELRETRKEFESQNDTLKLQRFENTFFQLLTLHHEIIDKLNFTENGTTTQRNVFQLAVHSLANVLESNQGKGRTVEYMLGMIEDDSDEFVKGIADATDEIKNGYNSFYLHFGTSLSHYFRNLYHIFKYIHTSELLSNDQKQFYATLVRAQLSPDELYLLLYNGVVEDFGYPNFLYLDKIYDILQNFDKKDKLLTFHFEAYVSLKSEVKDPFKPQDT